jgi:hypothetical protein
LRAFDAKSRLGVSPLILQPARDFQRRKFVVNTFRAVGSLCFFHVSLSRPEFAFASAPGAAKRFMGFEDFQNVRWLGAGELFGGFVIHVQLGG